MTLVFLDTETTGLADKCDVWEIGLIVRNGGGDAEYAWQIRPDLTNAEPTGLRIGRYYERINTMLAASPIGTALQTEGERLRDMWAPTLTAMLGKPNLEKAFLTGARHVAAQVALLLDGATVVGAVPDFDDRHLRRFLRTYGQAGTWHYHLVDVETLAAGALRRQPPWVFDELLGAYGLKYEEADRHTALGDARMVRDLYDAVYGPEKLADGADSFRIHHEVDGGHVRAQVFSSEFGPQTTHGSNGTLTFRPGEWVAFAHQLVTGHGSHVKLLGGGSDE